MDNPPFGESIVNMFFIFWGPLKQIQIIMVILWVGNIENIPIPIMIITKIEILLQ